MTTLYLVEEIVMKRSDSEQLIARAVCKLDTRTARLTSKEEESAIPWRRLCVRKPGLMSTTRCLT